MIREDGPAPEGSHALTGAQGATRAPELGPNPREAPEGWQGTEEEWLGVEALAFLRGNGSVSLTEWRGLTEAEQGALVKASQHLDKLRAEILARAIRAAGERRG